MKEVKVVPPRGAGLYGIRWVRDVRIPMPDGVTLAADLFLPDAAGPFPVVFEYLPYRKNDSNWWAGYWGHRYLAERGFVAARIDVRGTGDSEGTAQDEYCVQEQLDGVAAIAWLAGQPWSTGNVGMFGTSYGGFNTLQVAMHRPPALKAICPMYFTDRRYTDDCHYKGGAMQMLYDVASYGLAMVGRNLLPPRADLVGPQWAEIWEQHLANEPWLLRWVEHQTEDEQWLNGSLFTDYNSIQAATFLIGGWRDGYTNCNLRVFQNLTCPKKALIGPWLHTRPHQGVPGPRINHWKEMVRFYDYWLAGKDDGIMREPPIAIYVQEYDLPRMDRLQTSGYWRFETEWPLARGREQTLFLGNGALEKDAFASSDVTAHVDHVAYNPTVGASFGPFSAGGSGDLVPGDQRLEEALSLVYTSPALDEPIEILGYPRAILHVASTADVAFFVVRLCDVAPDGASALVTKGILNATHRDSHRHPTPMTPGQTYELTIDLDATSWVFAPGHRIRVSVSNADFPNTWPSPKPAITSLYRGGAHASRIILPVVPRDPRELPAPQFDVMPEELDAAPPVNPRRWEVSRDPVQGLARVTFGGGGTNRIDEWTVYETWSEATATVSEREPARATVVGEQKATYHWPELVIQMHSNAHLQSDDAAFHLTIAVEITQNGIPSVSKRWMRSFPRILL